MNDTEAFGAQLYIHRPALQTPPSRHLFRAATVAAWAAYLYLWLPLATLLLWWAGSRLGLRELGRYPQYIDLDLFRIVAATFAVATLFMIGWAEYNRIRFQGIERRKPHPPMDPLDTAEAMGASRALTRDLQACRRVIIRLDANAVPQGLLDPLPMAEAAVLREPEPA